MEQQETTLLETVRIAANQCFEEWCREHKDSAFYLPLRGRLYGALIVLSNLEDGIWSFFELDQATSTDQGNFFADRSIRRHTRQRVSAVLTKQGREFLAPNASKGELGRTSTGTKRAGLQFIHLIQSALAHAPQERLDEQGNALVAYLYNQIFSLLQQHHELGGIDVNFSASESIATYISKVLDAHKANPGAVLQHLIGAKLEIRFEGQPITIQHNSSATADAQTGRRGDFEIGSTVFHVTKKANDDHYRKARLNAASGRKVYLLVPDNVLRATKDLAEIFEQNFCKKVDVFSIEQFVAQNLDELAVFDRDGALRRLRLLLEKYNELVGLYENDASLKTIIPDFGVE